MDSNKKCILVVDDSPDDIHFVMEGLSEDYAFLAATSGEKALQIMAKGTQIDLILMDVEMPAMNGYETCRRVKSNETTRDIDIIFISSHDTVEEKLAGYDAGGCDYLIKPVQPLLLQQKVELAIANKKTRNALANEHSAAVNMAMTALSNAGELGVVIDFMRNSFTSNDAGSLAKLIVQATGEYGLQNSVRISIADEIAYASSREPIAPLEQELLSRLNGKQRITEWQDRLILNFEDITQLIKKLPKDEEKRGRLRDHLAILLEGAEARTKALHIQKEMSEIVVDAKRALVKIE